MTDETMQNQDVLPDEQDETPRGPDPETYLGRLPEHYRELSPLGQLAEYIAIGFWGSGRENDFPVT